MHPDTPLRESHDCGITLQHKIERLEQVERCFVHVDYQERMVDDHDPLTPLAYKTQQAASLPPPAKSPKLLSTEPAGAQSFVAFASSVGAAAEEAPPLAAEAADAPPAVQPLPDALPAREPGNLPECVLA